MNPNLLEQIKKAESTELKAHLAITGLTTEQLENLWSFLQVIRGQHDLAGLGKKAW